MVNVNLASSVVATALISLSTAYFVRATPFGQDAQRPFQLVEGSLRSQSAADGSRNPAMEYALKALGQASAQVIDTFETVMAELGDVSKHLTWSLPKKVVIPRPSGWDYTVSSAALPDHALRVKKPRSLGVDHVKQYSGYLDVSDSKHFFYWFFESRNDPKKDPIVLWLNGGPGCSSLTGLFMELGPSRVNKAGSKPLHNPYSWNNNASVIFLDQPINVGYSYGDDSVSDSVAAGKDVYALLVLFFKQFPEYKDLEFHIAGESYAGHYIPVFASEILAHQEKKASFFASDVAEEDVKKLAHINLKSLLIGNGLTDGKTQYAEYANMACNNSYGPVLSDSECESMDAAYPRCAQLIQSCYDNENVWSCVPASLYCNNAMIGPYQRTGQNVYDVREKCEDSGNLCYPILGSIQTYLNRNDVMDALGAEVSNYESCNMNINRNFLFAGDWFKPYHLEVPKILERGISVLIYAGDADYICNWMGNQAWTEALEWPGAKNFRAATTKEYRVKKDGKSAGVYKSAEGFSFMRVYGAGHMVPYNQPENSLAMFNDWLAGEI